MSKELESFERIKNITYDRTNLYGIEVFRKDLDIIEDALKRLEVYDKCNYHTTIHKDVLQISKELTTLEIIKNKLVCIKAIYTNLKVEEYNNYVDLTNSSPYHLTKEEFEILREWVWSYYDR